MSKAPYWISLTVVVAGLYLAANWDTLPPFGWGDALGLAFIGLIIYWISRPRSVRSEDATNG